MIGMPVDNPLPAKTAISLFKTGIAAERIGLPISITIEVSGIVTTARDMVLNGFLASDCDRLFWIDSDMVWEPIDFLRMVAFSTLHPVVCAAYPAKVEGAPTFYWKNEEPTQPDAHGLMEIDGTGLGFTIINREVAEAVSNGCPRIHDQISGRTRRKVFRVDVVDGHERTEDIAFFADIRAAGYPVMLNPNIELGHIGEREWRGRIGAALNHQEQPA